MKLTFHGAAGEVTGSCFLLETSRARVLIDFGMHQGTREADKRNRRPPPLDAPNIDAVVLTHAHLDHCGRLPLLVGANYTGPIYATPATIALTEILLRDSANIQAMDIDRLNVRRHRRGLGSVMPLYDMDDVDEVLKLFKALPYWEEQQIARGVRARLVDAGHILGSASLELTVQDGESTRKVVFSGDIGQDDASLVRDPTEMKEADVLVLESTYGNRDHRSREATLQELREVLVEATAGSGKVLIPSFAVGRSQNLIYEMGRMHAQGEWNGDVPVILDSPMAIDTTDLYMQYRELLDDKVQAMLSRGEHPLRFPMLRFTRSADESRKINQLSGAAVIIAGAGMCTGGRIVHHLKHNLWRPEAHVVIAGYQANGTLGRRIVDGQKRVRILGEPIVVKAKIHTIGGLSAHAGQSGLLAWAKNFDPSPGRIFLTHGEPAAREALAVKLREGLKVDVGMPGLGETVEL